MDLGARRPSVMFGGPAARSYDASFRIVVPQFGRFDRCVARPPSDIDFSCGFHASLRVGHALEQPSRGSHLVIEFCEQ